MDVVKEVRSDVKEVNKNLNKMSVRLGKYETSQVYTWAVLLILLGIIVAGAAGCQSYNENNPTIEIEYYESGPVKRIIITDKNIDRDGVPNWSENKNITVRGSLVK